MRQIAAFLLQEEEIGGALLGGLLAVGGTMMLVMLVVAVLAIIGIWKVFVKAGQPGWAILVPLYNVYILLKIAGRPGWWLLLMIIPLVNIVIAALVAIDIAKAFGQSAAFGILLLFLLSGIGYVILGYGNYKYVGPVKAAATA
jgi:hypothetical protein